MNFIIPNHLKPKVLIDSIESLESNKIYEMFDMSTTCNNLDTKELEPESWSTCTPLNDGDVVIYDGDKYTIKV